MVAEIVSAQPDYNRQHDRRRQQYIVLPVVGGDLCMQHISLHSRSALAKMNYEASTFQGTMLRGIIFRA